MSQIIQRNCDRLRGYRELRHLQAYEFIRGWLTEEFFEIADPTRLEPATLSASGFDSGFDWTTKLQKNFVVGKFIDGRLAGLIAFRRVPEDLSNYVDLLEVAKPFRHRHIASKLLAIVMLDSQHQPNFGGFVQLTTKFNGVENFYFHLHGDLFGNKFFFYEDVSQSLVKQYLPQGGFIQWMSPQSNND